MLRLGLDLGTTGLVGRLWSADGQVLVEAATANPQQQFGADVILRMEAAQNGAGDRLQKLLVEGINRLIGQLLQQSGVAEEQIMAAAAAANPAISHFFAGHSVERILFPPHRPTFRAGEQFDCAALGINLSVPVFLLPLVSGYVGGDLLALLLGAPPITGPTLYVDLGTNAELALWDGQNWLVTSVAAGPAFEAGNLSFGMQHSLGAVSDVEVENDRLVLTVVGGGAPGGICGSGVFAAISSAVHTGLIATDGRIRSADEVASNLSRYLITTGDECCLQLYRDARCSLQITQTDLRAFQLAKGAVRAGIDCLLQRSGLNAGEVVATNITGALGSSLPIKALKGVAMLPEIMLEKARFLPAAVLDGLLVSLQSESEVSSRLAAALKAYPLSGTPAFEQAFMASLDFS